VYFRNNLGTELRRTTRHLHQRKVPSGKYQSRYVNEFSVHQEQTSYCTCRDFKYSIQIYFLTASTVIERDPDLLDRVQECSWLDKSPYLSLIRFDKSTKYHIIPKTTREGYKPRGSACGMIAGPYGVTLSEHSLGYFQLRPTVLIRDRSLVWRSGNGERLNQPTSVWEKVKAELRDSFGRATSQKFKYRLPAAQLLKVVGLQKIPEATLQTVRGWCLWYCSRNTPVSDGQSSRPRQQKGLGEMERVTRVERASIRCLRTRR